MFERTDFTLWPAQNGTQVTIDEWSGNGRRHFTVTLNQGQGWLLPLKYWKELPLLQLSLFRRI